jgi:hypothetical protein
VKSHLRLHVVATDSPRSDLTTVEACAWRSLVDSELDGWTATTADAVDDGGGRLRSKLRRVDRPGEQKVEQFALLQR